MSPRGYLAHYPSGAVTHLDGGPRRLRFFVYSAVAGPSACPLAGGQGTTARELYDRFRQSFARLDPRRAGAEGWASATDVGAGAARAQGGAPEDGVRAAVLLWRAAGGAARARGGPLDGGGGIGAWTADAEAIFRNPGLGGYETSKPQWTLGVLCSDQGNRWYGKTLDDLRPLLEDLGEESIVGEIWIRTMPACTGWPIEATEVFSGPLGGDKATPILFVGNTYDPVTPFDKYVYFPTYLTFPRHTLLGRNLALQLTWIPQRALLPARLRQRACSYHRRDGREFAPCQYLE